MSLKLAKSTKDNVIKKMIAFLLVVVLTMFDFIFLGTEMVSYAADVIETSTNNKNVTFDCYFKAENGTKVTEKEEKINNPNIKLSIHVSVKNDGYFNGTVSLKESNFNLKEEKINTNINKLIRIEDNTLFLDQINSGEALELEIGIEPKKEDNFNSSFLNMQSSMSINGIYKNSKEKEIEINATRKVELKLADPYADNEGAEISSSILTNQVYEIDGTNKRVLQLLVESGLKDNGYPIKEDDIQISVPNDVEEVEVNSRGILSSNGKGETEFTKNNWNFNKKDKTINISVKNNVEDKTIKWIKKGKDKFVVTYVMNPEINLDGTEIVIKNAIKLYDEKETTKNAATSIKVQKETDGIITTGIELNEQSIYKGKIYSGEDRDYKLVENIFVNSNKIVKNAEVELNDSTYMTANGEIGCNSQYKNTEINKAEVMRVLGEDGTLKVLTKEGTLLAEINNKTESDENGNITINYPEGTTSLKVVTTNVKETGTIALTNTKTIKQDGNNIENKRNYNSIIEKMTGAEATIELKETETRAEVKTSRTTLSTLAKNENVGITAILVTDNEKYDLFKNPTFEILLPENIQNLELKSVKKIFDESMFSEPSIQVIEGNNRSRIIRIELQGEQTSYTTAVNQTTILITADIEFDILAPAVDTSISMTYTNQNGILGSYSTNQSIQVESKPGLMMYTTMSGFNNENETITTMNDEIAKGSLDIESTAKAATVKETLINNYDEAIQNVSIIGKIPTSGINDGTINTRLLREVKTSLPATQVLYSKNENATENDDSWQASSEDAKSFKIDVTNLEKGAKVETEYSFEIPENLDYGQSMYAKIDANYTYLENKMIQTSTLGAETAKLTGASPVELKNSVETVLDNGLKVNIGTTTAGRELNDGDSVYEGQAIKYAVYITNNTGRDLKNVNLLVIQENGTMYGLKEVEVYTGPTYMEGEDLQIQHAYRELDTNTKSSNNIENFENGATKAFTYEIIANQVDNSAQTQGKITIKADNLDEANITTISNPIEQAELKLSYSYRLKEEVQLYAGQRAQTLLKIENISDDDIKNARVTVRLPEGTNASKNCIFVEDEGSVTNINYNTEKNLITFEIPEIKKEQIKTVIIYADTTDFKEEEKDLVFLAEAVTESEKTYYSNFVTRNIKRNPIKAEIVQEANIGDNQALNYGDEFSITITAINNSNTNIAAKIADEFPKCFKVTDAEIILPNEAKKLEIINYNAEEAINTNLNSYIINNETTNEMKLEVNENIDPNQQVRVVLNVVVDSYISEETVKNIAKLVCGQVEGEYYINSETIESEKTYRIDNMDNDYYIEVAQTANKDNKSTVKNGDVIVYTTKIKNTSNNPMAIIIRDTLPSGIEANEITLGGENVTANYSNTSFKSNTYELDKKQETELIITAQYNEEKISEEELVNIVSIETPVDVVRSNPITYYASSQESNIDGESTPNDGEGENSTEPSLNIKYNISGLAWLDSNKNGKRESDEKLMGDIEVKLIDAETGYFVQENGNDITTKTQNDGTYTFNVQRGNYIVAFMYDSNKYAITQYQKMGVSTVENSDTISKQLTINDNDYEIAVTDMIKLISNDIVNIDMGLLENTKFDFEFAKYIDEITVKTSKSSNTYTYNNSELAKVEIHAKELNNANVIIKYTMRITNNGEIAGYVKDVVDYMPSALLFNSELNNDWYLSGNTLHNTSLLNTKIGAGETKDITLILTKDMTENNTGLISNLAELSDVNNELGVEDLDSTPLNKAQGEDDLGKADVIISVKTGALVMYISLVLVLLVIIGAGAFMINKKVLDKNNIEEDLNF